MPTEPSDIRLVATSCWYNNAGHRISIFPSVKQIQKEVRRLILDHTWSSMLSASDTSSHSRQQSRPLYAPHESYDNDAFQEQHRSLERRLGLNPWQPIKAHSDGAEFLLWPRIRALFQEGFSEFLGSMILTLIYHGTLAQTTLGVSVQPAPGGTSYGSYQSLPWG